MWHISDNLDCEELAALAQEFYGDADISRPDFLRWQYIENPAGRAIGYAARKEDNAAIGQYVVIPQNIYLRGRIVSGSLSLNTLTRPEYAGQGIFTALARETYRACIERQVCLTYGFPNRNSYYGFINKLGFQDIGSLNVYLYPLDIAKLAEKKVGMPRLGKFLCAVLRPQDLFFKMKRPDYKDIAVKEIKEFEESYEDFWSVYKDYYSVILWKNKEYMNWRYMRVPGRKYLAYLAVNPENDEIQGCIVTRIEDMLGLRVGLIVDFMLKRSSGGQQAGRCLLWKAIGFLKENGAEMVMGLFSPQAKEKEILREQRFVRCPERFLPQPVPVILKTHLPVEEDPEREIERISAWFLTLGDYDVG